MKLIVLNAPSGAGKSTIAKAILARFKQLGFSISATTRNKRAYETEGVHYYYLSIADFKQKIDENAFIEYEEVYENMYYGTLKAEIGRMNALGQIPILDIDVEGAQNVKKQLQNQALLLFIAPPSLADLEIRLRNRGTETEETLKQRLDKAAYEMTFADKCDVLVVNDDLDKAIEETSDAIERFIAQSKND